MGLYSVVAGLVTDLADPIYLIYEVVRNLYWAMLITGTVARPTLLPATNKIISIHIFLHNQFENA